MPSQWMVFDRIRALTRRHHIYQVERNFQDQADLSRVAAGGEILNPTNQSASILDQTNLQLHRLERYKDYEQMDQCAEISLALDLYADEACLDGQTHIPLLDGSCPTIAELAARGEASEFWLYAFDNNTGQYIPARGRAARVTGQNKPTVLVQLDDGSQIRCTPDHLFMLSDGSFCRAHQLQQGDSLKPLYKTIRYRASGKGGFSSYRPNMRAGEYEFLYNGHHFVPTHRWVYGNVVGCYPEVVHHEDFNSRNNTPNNLLGMSEAAHRALHARHGADNPSFKDITLQQVATALRDWVGPLTKEDVFSLCDIGDRVLARLLAEAGTTWDQFKLQWHRCACGNQIGAIKTRCKSYRRRFLSAYHQTRKADPLYRERRNRNKRAHYQPVQTRRCRACRLDKPADQFNRQRCSYSPYCNDCRPTACAQRYLKRSFLNHKVVQVVDGGIAQAVYDIEVPGYHCFAAGTQESWVIVHNSMVDPERKHTLTIRAHSRRLKRELEDLFFNRLAWDNQCRPAMRYLCKYGDFPAEIITDQHRNGVAALRFMNVYNFTRVETRFGDLVGFFFQDEVQAQPVFLHPWQVMHLRLTSFENIYAPYGRCEVFGTRVATPSGYINIESCKAGDEVYCFDGAQLVTTRVVAACHSGKKHTYRIKTKHYRNECSGNHPVMVRTSKSDQQSTTELIYKRADELQLGDELVIPRLPGRDDGPDLLFEPIIAIEDGGIQETADIQVDHPASNFIADGVVVHNSIIDGGRKAFKQLRLAEDAALVYRLTRAPEKLKFKIPVGNIPQRDVPEYLRSIAATLKRQRFYNVATGTFDERYSPLIQDDYIILPVRCLSGRERIPLLDGRERTLAELIEEYGLNGRQFYVYSYDLRSRKFAPGLAKCVRGPRRSPMVRVTLDDSSIHDVTPDHLFYLRDGSAKQAQHLLPGDSLLALYRRKHKLRPGRNVGEYEQLLDPDTHEWQFTHRLIMPECPVNHVRHHADFNRFNNRPDNLQVMDIVAHKELHARHGGRIMSEMLKRPELKEKFLLSDICAVSHTTLSRYAKLHGYNRVRPTHEQIVAGIQEYGSVAAYRRASDTPKTTCYRALRALRSAATASPERPINHTVLSVEPLDKPEDTFCLEVDGVHNFMLASGVIVHNSDGSGPEVDILPGAENLDQIADIEYFKKKMVSVLKIPFARVGIGEGAGEAHDKSLSQSSSEFAKAVQWVQREMVCGLTKVAIVHLALRGYKVDDIKGFELAMSATSAMEELYRMETWQTRTGVLLDMKELGWFPKSWLITHFTDLTPDEIEELKEMESIEAAGGEGGLGGGAGTGGAGGAGGLEDMLGAGGEEEPAPEEPAAPGLGTETAGGEPAQEDRQVRRRLLTELRRLRDRKQRQRLVEHVRAIRKRQRNHIPDTPTTNGYDYLLESKELDGLSKTTPEPGQRGTPYDPNGDPGILVEWSVAPRLREGVLQENLELLVESVPPEEEAEPGEIVLSDLPERNGVAH